MPESILSQRPPLRGISAAVRAERAWQRIQDKPSSVTVYRNTVAQAAQTVRVEFMLTPSERREAGEASVRRAVLFGVADHPTQADTDLAKGDLFTYDGGQYRVIDVVTVPGEVQAFGERIT